MSSNLIELQDETEQLKSELPHATSQDEALQIALDAAEVAMKALRLAKDAPSRKLLTSKVQSLLDEAERIKRSNAEGSDVTPTPESEVQVHESSPMMAITLEPPVSKRPLTRAEEILLLKASKLNGFKFAPWKDAPSDSEFDLRDGEQPFLDTPELRLSSLQQEVFDAWKRPAEALPPPTWSSSNIARPASPTMRSNSIDLVQDAATDCSVVASLCAGVARGQRGHAKILRNAIYPSDRGSSTPKLSPNGRYIVKLNFNGCFRRVDIDDRLPVSKTSRVIHVVDRRNPSLLWPALLEKAYLKVRGSYDFPGSNSGTDLWILSGWIPEQIFLQSDDTIPSDVWRRIHSAHRYGDVLVTLGTGKMSARVEKQTGLAGEHDYAVLDLREVDGQRLMLIKNPWCDGSAWRGSAFTVANYPDDHRSTHGTDLEDDLVPSSRDLLNADDQLSPGTFWMDLNSVVQHFESIYLNWNPGLFTHRQDIHFQLDLTPKNGIPPAHGRFKSFSDHPQFTLTQAKAGTTWILLSRHFQDNNINSTATVAPSQQMSGFISLYAFDNKGVRVFLSDQAVERGPFVDSPQTLLRLENLEPNKPYTIVPAEQDLSPIAHSFTISAFSVTAITIETAPDRYPFQKKIAGAWTEESAGGNAHSPTYADNPQFSISMPQKSSLTLLLETAVEGLNVHVKLLHGGGQRAYAVRSRDIVCDSKDYRRCCALAEVRDLDPGKYTIICSTFDAGQQGSYTLRLDSTSELEVAALPREGAGRVRTRLANATFYEQQLKMAAPLHPKRLSRVRLLVKQTNQISRTSSTQVQRRQRSMIRVTIELGRGPERRFLMASGGGEFNDSLTGVRTEEVDISPQLAGRYPMSLVIERRFTPKDCSEEVLQVEMFTDTAGAVDVDVWRDWSD